LQNWIFQAIPDRYDVFAALENPESIAGWSITRHAEDVQPGDRAILWVGGRKSPGVYAIGTVTGEPYWQIVDDPGWQREEDQGQQKLWCPITFDTILAVAPILRAELMTDPRFAGSRIMNQPFAGNPFRVTDQEWEAIADRLHGLPRRSGRTVANVWLEVQHRARQWMETGTPVYTLKRNVRNIITGVTDSRIDRRSDDGRSAEHTPVTRTMIENLWEALLAEGHTRNVNTLYFAHALLQRAIPGIGFEETPTLTLVLTDLGEATRTFDPGTEEVPGLTTAPPTGGGRGRGGGGEGEVHAALKAKVKTDPVAAVGERLTYISEDLTERLGDEISFITGDRVDLLMKDEQGRYVVIEVEPVIGPSDHIGFHQAAKYWALVAVAKGIDLDRVRRMVVATTIDPGLRDHYYDHYAIESAEVSLP